MNVRRYRGSIVVHTTKGEDRLDFDVFYDVEDPLESDVDSEDDSDLELDVFSGGDTEERIVRKAVNDMLIPMVTKGPLLSIDFKCTVDKPTFTWTSEELETMNKGFLTPVADDLNELASGRTKEEMVADFVSECGTEKVGLFEKEMRASIAETGKLPEELADTFTINLIKVGDETRAILNWA